MAASLGAGLAQPRVALAQFDAESDAAATSCSRARFRSRLSVGCAIAFECCVVSAITVTKLWRFIKPTSPP
jgi:hypothetical protein